MTNLHPLDFWGLVRPSEYHLIPGETDASHHEIFLWDLFAPLYLN